MSSIPGDLRYTREHEWARKEEDGRLRIGISDHAQDQLGDVVYLDLPEVGSSVTSGAPMGEVESTKSVSDIYAPVTGTVSEVNEGATEDPASVNQDPYGAGWLVLIQPEVEDAYDGLLSAEDYAAFLAEQHDE